MSVRSVPCGSAGAGACAEVARGERERIARHVGRELVPDARVGALLQHRVRPQPVDGGRDRPRGDDVVRVADAEPDRQRCERGARGAPSPSTKPATIATAATRAGSCSATCSAIIAPCDQPTSATRRPGSSSSSHARIPATTADGEPVASSGSPIHCQRSPRGSGPRSETAPTPSGTPAKCAAQSCSSPPRPCSRTTTGRASPRAPSRHTAASASMAIAREPSATLTRLPSARAPGRPRSRSPARGGARRAHRPSRSRA